MKTTGPLSLPTVEQLERELEWEQNRKRHGTALRAVLCSVVTAAAIAVLLFTFCFSALHIFGSSMAPTIQSGSLVIAVKGHHWEPGDIAAFYSDGKILVKRVIASPGDWVDLDADGNVSINGQALEEPYLEEPSMGSCDIEFPCQVPEGNYFLMGDNRAASVDSRSNQVGFIAEEQMIGRVVFQVWPLKELGMIG